jgi:hypothetical protein
VEALKATGHQRPSHKLHFALVTPERTVNTATPATGCRLGHPRRSAKLLAEHLNWQVTTSRVAGALDRIKLAEALCCSTHPE